MEFIFKHAIRLLFDFVKAVSTVVLMYTHFLIVVDKQAAQLCHYSIKMCCFIEDIEVSNVYLLLNSPPPLRQIKKQLTQTYKLYEQFHNVSFMNHGQARVLMLV